MTDDPEVLRFKVACEMVAGLADLIHVRVAAPPSLIANVIVRAVQQLRVLGLWPLPDDDEACLKAIEVRYGLDGHASITMPPEMEEALGLRLPEVRVVAGLEKG